MYNASGKDFFRSAEICILMSQNHCEIIAKDQVLQCCKCQMTNHLTRRIKVSVSKRNLYKHLNVKHCGHFSFNIVRWRYNVNKAQIFALFVKSKSQISIQVKFEFDL